MSKILVLYGSCYGQTQKISEAMARELEGLGNAVTLADAKGANDLRARGYDAVLVGAPVYAGKYPTEVSSWARREAPDLAKRPAAFFSVCLGILEKQNPKTQAEERRIVKGFFDLAGWYPSLWTIFAGAVKYREYGWLKRLIMKLIVKRGGGSTDTSRDHEYTDWDAVARFARDFSASLAKRPEPHSALS